MTKLNWLHDIPKIPHCYYRMTASWNHLEQTIKHFLDEYGLDLNPDFQREHVWTEAQQSNYIEYALKIPQSGLEIYFNHPGWQTTFEGNLVLVDGKQRLEAARKFLRNELKAYGCYCNEIEWPGNHVITPSVQFYFNIARIQKKSDVLKWYIDFNAGGTPHTNNEIAKVKHLLANTEEDEKNEITS